MRKAALLLSGLLLLPAPALARDSLGIWNAWGAFRDMGVPRCYAIAMATAMPGRRNDFQPYLTVGTWPRRGTRGEVHVRLSRRLAPGGPASLSIAGQKFALVPGQADAWSQDGRMDAAIVAAMRSATDLTVTARAANGLVFKDYYRLAGAASAMDAAALGCAGG
ncbi:MAG: hypothetical protein RIS94_1352 [Pseudomonadota bacterium]|jgi:hypothetical protein